MELRSYWAILKRRWAAPVVIPLLVALFSAVQLQPWQAPAPSYSVTMRMLVGVLPLDNADGAHYDPRYYAWMTSEYLVDDFTEVLTTQLFAQAINARLSENGLSIPSGLIQAQANTGQRHRIIRLSFTWHHPAELQAIANATVAELEENAAAYFSQLGTESAGISLLDSPTVAQVAQSARQRVEWPLRILLALVAGVAVAFLREYLDETVRRRQDLEEIGIAVLTTVPKRRGFGLAMNRSARKSRTLAPK